MPPHSTNFELSERLTIETLREQGSQGTPCEKSLRNIIKTREMSVPERCPVTPLAVPLYFLTSKDYPHDMGLATGYVEQSGKFRERVDQEVFLLAKGGDQVALDELIYRAVSRNEAFVVSGTRSISSRDPDYEPECVISFCLTKVLGLDNSRFHKKVESVPRFFGGFHEALKNRIKGGYRKLGVRPMVLTDSQMGADGDDWSSWMENLSNEHGLYAAEDQENDRRPLVLRVAIKRCLNARESEHLRLYAEGLSARDRMGQLGFGSINATDLSIMQIKRKLKGYIRKHPELFDL